MTGDDFVSALFSGTLRKKRRTRDSQRSAVYAWERASFPRMEPMRTVEEVEEYLRPIWRSERGRYGLAKRAIPNVHHGHWGQRSALAYVGGNTISLPRWARTPVVILHELAHLLVDGNRRGGAHGPRFVGVFIGLAARHLGLDAEALMASADERGVRYDVRSIGAVPRVRLADRLADVLPATPIEAAVALGVSYRQVHGAALRLVGAGRAGWSRGRLVALAGPPRPPRGLVRDYFRPRKDGVYKRRD